MTDTPKPKKLTIKQKKFVKAYVANDGNGVRAAQDAYNVKSYSAANSISGENLQKPAVREAIEASLEKHGITMDAAIKPIADGLQASKELEVNGKVVATQVDHSIRLKASSMALKLMGAEKSEDKGGITFNFKGNANFSVDKYRDSE